MPVIVSPMREEDIDGAITAIQQAFANDPYNLWVYNDRSKASCFVVCFTANTVESVKLESFKLIQIAHTKTGLCTLLAGMIVVGAANNQLG